MAFTIVTNGWQPDSAADFESASGPDHEVACRRSEPKRLSLGGVVLFVERRQASPLA